MTSIFVGDGRLMAVGTIVPGTADVFAAEVAKRGGICEDGGARISGRLGIRRAGNGRLIRAKKFATESRGVARYCVRRLSTGLCKRGRTPRRREGRHRRASSVRARLRRERCDSCQRHGRRATCFGGGQRYLREMGIDLEVWVHAMETPKDQLYYFKPDELLKLKLATQAGKQTASEVRANLNAPISRGETRPRPTIPSVVRGTQSRRHTGCHGRAHSSPSPAQTRP